MSSLTEVEKRYLEKILGMGTGYLLDFTDSSFGEFFWNHWVDIHGPGYLRHGTSKAKKMRAFWEQEPDELVARVLTEMLDIYEANCDLYGEDRDERVLAKSREIVLRLLGKQNVTESAAVAGFLQQEFTIPDLEKLPVEAEVAEIIEARLIEVQIVFQVRGYLSVIFLCGSVLEAILLGSARKDPERFGRSAACPKKRDGAKKKIHDWSLSELIDVACDIGLIKQDVKKFSHVLRDFRNYIHPNEQIKSGFAPDQYTAQLCFQTLKAALADVAGERDD